MLRSLSFKADTLLQLPLSLKKAPIWQVTCSRIENSVKPVFKLSQVSRCRNSSASIFLELTYVVLQAAREIGFILLCLALVLRDAGYWLISLSIHSSFQFVLRLVGLTEFGFRDVPMGSFGGISAQTRPKSERKTESHQMEQLEAEMIESDSWLKAFHLNSKSMANS